MRLIGFLVAIAVLLLITGFDPFGPMTMGKAIRWSVNALIVGFMIAYVFWWPRRSALKGKKGGMRHGDPGVQRNDDPTH